MVKTFLTFLFLLFAHLAIAQNITINGKVVDAEDRKPLAFVNIIYGDPPQGTTTDIDGRFSIEVSSATKFVKISYLGYYAEKVRLDSLRHHAGLTIELKQKSYQLERVLVKSGINPADDIIRKVYENRKKHNPESLPAFSYKSYNKFVFTIDTSNTEEPHTPGNINDTASVDSTEQRIKKFLEKQHIFLMESVTQRKYLSPDYSNEKVLASRISGFRDPSLVFLTTQIQSFSFYDKFITLDEQNYLNPISQNSTNKYLFQLEDTLIRAAGDTTFIISFRPRENKNFDALKGMVHVNRKDYALTRVIAQPFHNQGNFTLKVQQKYEKTSNGQWFPVQLNTRIRFNSILISTDEKNYHLVGDGKMYLRDINLNPTISKSDFDEATISVPESAYRRSDTFWKKYRTNSLTNKDRTTYRVIDSLGEAQRFDSKLRTFKTLSTGYLPFKFLKIDLRKILNYNEYEGLRLGLGIMTNDSISKFFSTGGYFGYGFRDNNWKYGARLQLNLQKDSESQIEFSWYNDVTETGGYKFLEEKSLFSSQMFRQYLVESMDHVQALQGSYSVRILKYLRTKWFFRKTTVNPFADYQYTAAGKTYTEPFHITEAGFKFRYAWKENFADTPWGNFSLGTDYPVIYGNYIRGIDWLDGNFEYSRIEGAISDKLPTRNFGETRIKLVGGLARGNIPAFNLYTGHGSFGSRFNIYAGNSFATMKLSEFLADRFISLFITQDFKSLLFRTHNFQPQIEWINNLGWGWLDDQDNHQGFEIRSFEKGYFETGLLLNNLLNTPVFNYGFGIFYRYGPYSFDKFADNMAYKLTLQFNFAQ